MATFREIMDAAHRADAAGDVEGAKRLLTIASDLHSGKGYNPPQSSPELILPQAYEAGEKVDTREPDRFGDTIEVATREPRQAFRHFAGEALDGDNSAGERLKSGALAALAGAGTVYGMGAGLVGEVLGGSPTNERKLARDLMMMGEVSAPELAGVSSTARLAGKAGREVTKLDRPVTATQETARAADRLGVTPALGATSKTQAHIAAGLEKVPFAGSAIARDAMRYVDDIEAALAGAVANVGKVATPERAGDVLQAGLGEFASKFRKRSDELYSEVGKHIPGGTRLVPKETVDMIFEAVEPFMDQPKIMQKLGLNDLWDLGADLEKGLSWEAATALRSKIGQSVGKINGPLADMDQGRLKQVYGKLTADLETAAKAAGPQAEKAWKRAASHYKAGAQRISDYLDKSIKADSPERAFEAFVNFAKKDRASSDIRRMYAIRKSVSAEDWQTISASIINRLGRKGDDFSPAKFVTEWGKLSDDAKAVLLSPRARKEMESIISLAEGAKRINAERNFSNTGSVNAILATIVGTGAAPTTTATALVGANITARAMTSERFLRAANRMARGDDRMMKAIAKSGEPYAQDAATVLRMASAEAAGAQQAANVNDTISSQVAP